MSSLGLLQACGGGGPGGSSNVRPDSTPPPSGVVTEPTLTEIPIAVIDSEFLVAHSEFDGLAITSFNVLAADSEMGRSEIGSDRSLIDHGTPVAALVAGRTFGHSETTDLRLIRVSDREDGAAGANAISQGMIAAAEADARVINASYSGAQHYLNSKDLLVAIRPAEGSHGPVLTVPAGNGGENLSDEWKLADFQATEALAILQQTLIVGGGNDGQRAANSNYPGEKTWIQERFLLAPYVVESASGRDVDATGTFSGTSFSAPIVAGMAGTILSHWPHLDSVQVSQLLLDTASADSPLYGRNDCGPDRATNCGQYYLGQGFADMEAAMTPQGELEVASGGHVDEGGQPLADTHLGWSPAFGEVLPASALAGAVAFDDLGRDYEVDLARQQSTNGVYRRRLRERVQEIATMSPGSRSSLNPLGPGLSLLTHMGPDGSVQGNRIQMDAGKARIGAFGFHQGMTGLIDPWEGAHGIPLLSDANAGILYRLEEGMGVDMSVSLHQGIDLRAQHWQASGERAAPVAEGGYRQNRSDLGLRFSRLPGAMLELGWAQRDEGHGVLGSSSGGALDLGEGLTTQQLMAGLTLELGDRAQWIARYERGWGHSNGGNGVVRSLSGLVTEQYLTGLQLQHDRHQAVLMLSRPLHVTGGTLVLDVPVGRDLEGNVVREQRRVDLGIQGGQTDIELGYAFLASDDARLQMNLLHTRDTENLRDSGSDTSWAVSYSRRF